MKLYFYKRLMSPVKGKLTCLSVIRMENIFGHLASQNLPKLLFFSRWDCTRDRGSDRDCERDHEHECDRECERDCERDCKSERDRERERQRNRNP